MTKKQILKILIRLHEKYSSDRYVTIKSDMCGLWSIYEPPDELEDTEQLDELEEALKINFEGDEAYEIYEMNIIEASKYIYELMKNRKSK